MIIELHGAGFYNKGAELMLRTAVAELSKRLEDVTFAVDPTVGPYQKRGELDLRQIVPPRWWMGSRRFRYGLTAQRMLSPLLNRYPFDELLDIYGGASLREIDALVDVSGFAFTDQWGAAPIRDFARLAEAYKKKGKPVVMLPQAFGPFDRSDSRKAMADLTSSVDVAYARDDISLQHARSASSDPQRIADAPDITLFYPEKIEEIRSVEEASHSCIIPNVRMLDQGEDEWGGRYEDILTKMGNTLVRSGERLYLLIHDTSGKDVAIARRVQRAMDSTPEILSRNSPIELKKIISRSRLVVTSRYHGAVAAFSNAIPSLCLGWSHKYRMLYRDFECESHIIKPEYDYKLINKKIKNLLDKKYNNKVRKSLQTKIDKHYERVKQMWGIVTKLLRNSK
jgi:colanic acid/amylovoran biosynthesis protein